MFNSYVSATRWGLLRKKYAVGTLIAVQVMFAFALFWGIPMIAGPGYKTDSATILGVWHLGVLAVGLTLAPQIACEAKNEGYFIFLTNYPISRFGIFCSEIISWLIISIPGLLVTPLLGAAKFGSFADFPSIWSFLLIFAAEFFYLCIGVGIALCFRLEIVQILSQFLIMFAMLFTPILFPLANLPDFLKITHQILPFEPVQRILTGSETGSLFFLITPVLWFAVAVFAGVRALGERK
ncbi:MAG: ABC transporter permease [Microbacteriaceae bacterium]|nr:ABC transporter permease [Microbacteriaceae bacterium]